MFKFISTGLRKSFFLTLMLIAFVACENSSSANPLNDAEDPRPPANEAPEGDIPEDDDFVMNPEVARAVADYVGRYLSEGVYRGYIEDGRDCRLEVSIDPGESSELKINLEVLNDEGNQEHELNFATKVEAPVRVFQAHSTSIRMSLEIGEAMMTPQGMRPVLSLLSVRYDDVGPLSVYLYNQSKVERDLSAAKCILESFEPEATPAP